MTRTSVVVLDDDDDLRHLMSMVFESNGASCVTVASVEELQHRESDVLRCDLALLDVNLGPDMPSGIDAYRWMQAQSFAGRVLFLTGHASSVPAVAEAAALGIEVLIKPVSTDALMSLLTSAHASSTAPQRS